MNHKIKIYLLASFLFASVFFVVGHVRAATLYLLPDQKSLSIGTDFNVDIKIDTSDASASINSAQATIQFPTGVLKAVSIDKQNSVFGFWLEEPTISNDNGTIHFVGGAIKGVSGSALQILRIKFKATGAGSAEFKIVDAAVAAADGKGTNVLSETKGASVVVGTNVVPPSIGGSVPSIPSDAEQPQIVKRTAVAATDLPAKPKLRVPFYPDESRWYSSLGETIVFWDLPPDVLQVSTRLSHAPDKVAGEKEQELLTGKNFGVLKEGVWYVRAQFRNNIGWGDLSYYKISIDTTPPVPFEIKIDNKISDNPSPVIQFETSDSLSGVAGYIVSVDGKEVAETTSTTMKLPLQAPGKHSLAVKANDLAGNSVQDSIEFEILPLPTPTIDFVTKSVSQGEFVFASGKGMQGASAEVFITGDNAREFFRGTVPVDHDGHWDITIEEPLAIGNYKISAIIRDDRGAISLASEPQQFKIKAKSILSFGFIELGWFEIFIIVILAAATGWSLWSWRNLKRAQMRGAYAIVLGRDVEKLSDLLAENINELSGIVSVKSGLDVPKLTYLIGKMKENIDKIKKYIKQEAEKLK